MMYQVLCGNCLELLKTLSDESIDAVVTDPPYGLSDHSLNDTMDCLRSWLDGKEYRPKKKGFMDHSWDAWVPGPEVWREVLRIMKPGSHLLAFAGTRSMDLMSMAVRLAGFELRDAIGYASDGGDPTQAPLLAWVYGSGFPKSRNFADQDIDGADRERWIGWGTALKPAWEPIILARKPLIGTVAENVLHHGTGALNINACRVEGDPPHHNYGRSSGTKSFVGKSDFPFVTPDSGRWPANLIHDGSDEVVALFPESAGSGGSVPNVKVTGYGSGIGTGKSKYFGGDRKAFDSGSGSAARFFYCAKASRKDRHEGIEDPGQQFMHGTTLRKVEKTETNGNNHPTVKPTELMRYLCRLVTPPGGTVLDPFMGSGSTGKSAMLEGFRFIGCELSNEYAEIAEARIRHAYEQVQNKKDATRNTGHQLSLLEEISQ